MAITFIAVDPVTGPTTGGTELLITGTDLDDVTDVTIGGNAADFELLNPSLIRTFAPAHAAGAVSIVLDPGAVTAAAAYTYAVPDSDDQLVSTLARKFKIEVNTGTSVSPTWTPVRAIMDLKPEVDPNLEEDDDYDSDGWGSKAKTMLNWKLEMKVGRKISFIDSAYDPGQEYLRQASTLFGVDGSVDVRWYDRNGGPEAYRGVGTVTWKPEGGSAKDLDSATITIEGQGIRNDIVNPAA